MRAVNTIRDKEKIAEALVLRFAMSIQDAQHFVSYLSRMAVPESGYLVRSGNLNDRLYIHFEGNAMGMYGDCNELNGIEGSISWISNQIRILNHIPIDHQPVIVDEDIWMFKGSTIYYMDFSLLKEALKPVTETYNFYTQQVHQRFDLMCLRMEGYNRNEIADIRLFNKKNPGVILGDRRLPYRISPVIMAIYFMLDFDYYCRILKML